MHIFKLLFIATLSFQTIANSIEFSYHNPSIKCDLLKGNLKQAKQKYNASDAKGTLIGYDFKGALPAARILIIDYSQNPDIIFSKIPKLIDSGRGCLIKFVADSPKGYDFYKPDFDYMNLASSPITRAQLLPTED